MAGNQKKQLKPWPKKYPGVHVSKTFPVGPDPDRPTRTDMIPGQKVSGRSRSRRTFPVGPDPYRPTRTDMGQVPPDREPDQE